MIKDSLKGYYVDARSDYSYTITQDERGKKLVWCESPEELLTALKEHADVLEEAEKEVIKEERRARVIEAKSIYKRLRATLRESEERAQETEQQAQTSKELRELAASLGLVK